MVRTIKIDGMSCGHCSAAVERALKEVEQVSGVTVDLAAKAAVVTLTADVPDEVFVQVIDDAGYDVVNIS